MFAAACGTEAVQNDDAGELSRDAGRDTSPLPDASTTCSGKTHACKGVCVEDTSIATCGSSCVPCVAPLEADATCNGTVCGFQCHAGYVPRGNECVVPAPAKPELTLFGGSHTNGTLFSDTWTYDGSSWTQKQVTGPSPRTQAGVAALSGKVFLFGGGGPPINAPKALGDTWEWDGLRWREHVVQGPAPRRGPIMATLAGKVVLFGGADLDSTTPKYFDDTWEWDGNAWTQRAVTGPSARGFSAVSVLSGKMVIFSGLGPGVQGDTWEWDGNVWTQRTTVTAPSQRSMAAMGSLAGKLFLLGGINGGGSSDETWGWDGASWSTQGAKNGIFARHAMAPLGGKLIVFGGDRPLGISGETWEWDGSTWLEKKIAGPAAREWPVLVQRLP
ncbi:MAG: hypothetical protein U0174_07820 [Polyangiaceae bacterium]